MRWRAARGKIYARRGNVDEGVALAREAVRLIQPTDFLHLRGEALLDLAETLELAGRPDDALGHVGDALELFERKGDVVSCARARERLERLR